jgi:hypothetical protein
MIKPDFSAFGTPLSRATYLNSSTVSTNNIIRNIITLIAVTATVGIIIYTINKIHEKSMDLKENAY